MKNDVDLSQYNRCGKFRHNNWTGNFLRNDVNRNSWLSKIIIYIYIDR